MIYARRRLRLKMMRMSAARSLVVVSAGALIVFTLLHRFLWSKNQHTPESAAHMPHRLTAQDGRTMSVSDCLLMVQAVANTSGTSPSNAGKHKTKVTSLFFLKVHKTGSTTVQLALMRFGAARNLTFNLPKIAPGRTMSCSEEQMRYLEPCWLPNGKRDIICHHIKLPCSWDYYRRMVKDDAFWFTLIRKPEDHFESAYQFYGFSHETQIGVPFEKFLEDPDRYKGRIMKNGLNLGADIPWQNLMLQDLRMPGNQTGDMDAMRKYVDFLEKTLGFVMINEYMDESLILLRHKLGWDLQDVITKDQYRRIKADNRFTNFTAKQRENWKRINRGDHLLYDRFLKLFKKQLEDFGSERMEAELKALRCLRQAMARLCEAMLPTVLPSGIPVGLPGVDFISPDLLQPLAAKERPWLEPSDIRWHCQRLFAAPLTVDINFKEFQKLAVLKRCPRADNQSTFTDPIGSRFLWLD